MELTVIQFIALFLLLLVTGVFWGSWKWSLIHLQLWRESIFSIQYRVS